jgi:ribosomal protein L16 Arg81 hydroxylase
MAGDLAIELASQDGERYYNDPTLTPEMASETIDPVFIAQAKKLLQELLNDDDLIADWFARFMTFPKYPDLQEQTAEQRNARVGNRRYRNGELLD